MIRSFQGRLARAAAASRSATPCHGLRVPTKVTTGSPMSSGRGTMRVMLTPLGTVRTRSEPVRSRTQSRTGSETATVAVAAAT